ncbi:MAG: UDP-N-acetylmuramoyl-tripeptide--D-alanyl-D-alanine ligase [Bacteroidales bacterium]|nr:UDP-N-acetylmuramoyl-tripeptide--D-alanyl-D-alanine ligase [Bacteroidales bacterium]
MKTEQIYRIFREESTGISIDSRTVTKGQIFFALCGQNHNGNIYAGNALANGASWSIIDDPGYESENTILVDDCLSELQALATFHRKAIKSMVLAITGTNGKTTTKELISSVLATKYRVHHTKGNLNNEIGVPLTILSAPEDTEIMVIEMGANHIGEIKNLCKIAMPDFGMITNIGTAHIEGFGSAEGVLRAKSELYEYLGKSNGVAFYNDKDAVLTERILKTVNRAVPFSNPAGIDLRIEQLSSDLNLKLRVNYHQKVFDISSMLFGSYNIENIRAAMAVGVFLGVDIEKAVDAVQSYRPGNNRSEIKETGRNTLVCDSYNANPTSMLHAIGSFSGLKGRDKVLILGDMLELGEKSEEEHQRVLELVNSLDFDKVYLVGPRFHKAAKGTGYMSFPDIESISAYFRENILENKLVLIKGSRRMTLEKLYELM